MAKGAPQWSPTREQPFKIVLRLKGAIDNDNIGALTHRCPPTGGEHRPAPRDEKTDTAELSPDLLIEWDGYSD